jgi:hypothetical protein
MLGANKGDSPNEYGKHHKKIGHYPKGRIIFIQRIFVHGGNNSIYHRNSARQEEKLGEIKRKLPLFSCYQKYFMIYFDYD